MTSHTSITAHYLTRYQQLAENGDAAGCLPVTGAQRRFLLARHLAGGRPDLVPLFFSFPRSSIDTQRLARAASHLATIHPVLRTRATVRHGTPLLCLEDSPTVPVVRVIPGPAQTMAEALGGALARWQTNGPPLRLLLVEDIVNTAEVLAIVLDHAACDEQSLGQILSDLTAAYHGGLGPEDSVVSSVAEYRDSVLTQLEVEQRASGTRAVGYWTRRLDGVRPGARISRQDDQLVGSIRHQFPITNNRRATTFPAVLAAAVAAAQVTHGPDTVPLLGYPWGGRPAAAPPVLGCFLNTVVYPARTVDPATTAEIWWDDLDHADTPFDEVARAGRAAGTPLTGSFDGLLTFEDLTDRPLLELGGITGREIHIDERPIPAPFVISVSYATDLVVRMAWDRCAIADNLAHEAFAALLATLQPHTGSPSSPSDVARNAVLVGASCHDGSDPAPLPLFPPRKD